MAQKLAPLLPTSQPIVDARGVATISFAQFLSALAANNIGPLTSAANDTAAAKAGVPINGIYQNAGAVRVRLA